MDPTVGRIVHYQLAPDLVRPAIVTSVLDIGRVNLQVFLDGSENPSSEPGLMLEMDVSEGEQLGQWFWPPRAPGAEQLSLPMGIEGIAGELVSIPPTEPTGGVLVHANAADVKGYILFMDEACPEAFISQMKAAFDNKFDLPILVLGGKGHLEPVVSE